MRIIKLDAIDSTNTFLKEISSADTLEDYTIVVAKQQNRGRGQMGKVWASNAGENLTFSVFKRISNLQFSNQFYLSIVTSLALYKTLKYYNVPNLFVKWPNDILSANKKIAGILIENIVKKSKLEYSIIGIGLNVNQTEFNDLVSATSLKNSCGKTFDLDEVMHKFIVEFKMAFKSLDSGATEALKADYESKLFRKNKPSTFKNAEGNLFSGFIKGVSSSGNLVLLLEDEIIEEFTLNEITLLY
ncbi:BirA family biotin operon repressor/biotin-[acetyl-CoA-carboxylase] ligase [Lacinutrix venerupis]|uniref:biotin--[acetyl-CoA-carboxylase] ligase n=1 Tax=Lacinutrix venerupis TaxID=1486034 RepID=UPI000EB04956|nr:biotin--[acetyl-CoA-carboxylase] ligase [Lacinutrix venerupis]RLJ62548.1 BirA family biotin operon repressor/biotin-[acetyl-CoA-carboxylase] ligase [Lacinutrix venerupis]